MGGICLPNLMSDIRVLIVGGKNSDKYLFSVQKRHDILFIEPKTILDLHQRWSQGEDVRNGPGLSFIKQMKPFTAMNITISRIDKNEPVTKQSLCDIVEANGGTAVANLTSKADCLVTTEKEGRRYEKALEWGIPVLNYNWILDSVKRGSSLDMKYYDVAEDCDFKQRALKACLVWDQLDHVHTVEKKRYKSTEEDDDDTNVARQTKRNKSSLAAWVSLAKKPSILERSETVEPIASPKKAKEDKQHIFESLNFLHYGFASKQSSILANIVSSHGGRIDILDSCNSIYPEINTVNYIIIPNKNTEGKYYEDVLRFLELNSGKVQVVTEWFVERSLYYNVIKTDLWSKPMVLRHNFKNNEILSKRPVKLKVAISGFSGSELLHVEKIIKLLSSFLEFKETLTTDTNFLVINTALIGLTETTSSALFEKNTPEFRRLLKDIECNKVSLSSIKKKLEFCQENLIPMFSVNFLFDCFFEFGKPMDSIQISDLKWCIYFPKRGSETANLQQFRQFAESYFLIKDGKHKKSVTESFVDARKKNSFKISGKASESSLTGTSEPLESGTFSQEIGAQIEDVGTQVVYGERKATYFGGVTRKTRQFMG